MANEEHLKILREGVDVWNRWREDHPDEMPDLYRADLSRVDLTAANLSSANLSRAYLRSGRLMKANLRDAKLALTYLRGAMLRQADLSRARLDEANLTYAFLEDANLTGANLTWTNFHGAYLYRAVLTEARFGSTILADVDLRSVIGLETVFHLGPSAVDVDTLYNSRGLIPEVFLRGAGLSDTFIQYIPSLVEQPIQFYSVFISYSHKDKAFAHRLHDALQGRGIRCWLDEHQILPGDKIHVAVDQGIKLWDKVLLCCSKASLKSWWVENEVNLAIQKEQRLHKERGREVLALIPLNLDGYMFNPDWQSGWKGQITSRLAPDFTGWKRSHKKFEEQLERVVKALRADAGARGVVPPSRL